MGVIGRVLPFARRSAPMLLALDEVLLQGCQADGRASLTVYAWRGSWLSIGLGRSIDDIDQTVATADGIRTARRQSGGAAVLHRAQIGWSLVVPSDHPLGCLDIVESYRRHSDVYLTALGCIGIQARAATVEEARVSRADGPLDRVCFGSLAPYELVAGQPSRKLVGWGQIRRRGVVLHHAVLHQRQPAAIARYIRGASTALGSLIATRAIGVDEVGPRINPIDLRRELVEALRPTGLDFVECPLNADEVFAARRLAKAKYCADEWTARR